MQFSFKCVHCKTSLETEGQAVGRQVDCPACKRPVIVPQPVLDNGTSIGGFQIERRLGAGGMGEVFLARQLSMDRQVALKILPAHFAQNQTAKERFQSEVKNLARIQHGNIVTAIEAGEDTGVHFLAMTFVDGEDLHKRLDREKLIDEREALGIVRKVADTLRTVWEEYHILHRDIKPSNIMLDKRGDPKVMDLGLSKNLADNMSLTMTGAALGTPHYISPEQALNRTTIDFRSDIYSLGATLYHLTTGTLPYNGSSVAAIMIQHVNEPLPLPKERNPLLSDACSCLIETMMAKLPEHRHSSWSALIEDLDRVLAGLPPLTARPGPGQSVVGGMPTGFIHAKNVGREKRLMKPVSESVVPRWIIYAGIACLIFILLALIFALQRISNRKGRVPNVVAATELSGWPAAAENQGMRDVVAAEPMAGSQPRTETPRPMRSPEYQSFEPLSKWLKENPQDWDAGIAKLEKFLRENTDDHAPRKLAIDELRRLKTERDAAVRNKLAELSEAATAAFNNGDMVGSVAMLRNYSSPIAEQTAAGRETQAVRLEKMAAERQTEADLAVKQVLAAMNMSVARSVLAGDLQNAINVVRQNQNDLRFMGQAENLKQLVEQLQNILTLQGRIMASFAGVNASASDVEFKGQTERIEVRNVSSLTATAFRITKQGSGIARISRDFNYYDLSVNERLKRLPDTKTPETLILRGLLAMENREVSAARQFFINSSVSLGRIMLEYLDTMAKAGETAAGKFQSKVKP